MTIYINGVEIKKSDPKMENLKRESELRSPGAVAAWNMVKKDIDSDTNHKHDS